MGTVKKTGTARDEVAQSPARISPGAAKARDSPLRRLKAAVREREKDRGARQQIVLSTVEEYRSYVLLNEMPDLPNPDVDVIVRGMLLWKSAHTYNNRNLVRLHFTDAEPDATFQELREFEITHGVDDENRRIVDEQLLTVTVFGETLESQILPLNGSVVRIVNSRRRHVYERKFSQLVARPSDMTTE